MMALFLLLLMAYSLIGETFHEVTGTAMLILFITHTWLHRRWWKAVPKGHYPAYRCFITVLDFILLVLMLLQPLSGIAMSHHLFTFLQLKGVSAAARDIHLMLGYWSFVLMSLHLGLHIEAMLPAALRNGKGSKVPHTVLISIAGAVSLYGIYAFIHRQLPLYMFRRMLFAFFDFSEPVLLFLLDYLAIMILFSSVGACIGKLLKKSSSADPRTSGKSG